MMKIYYNPAYSAAPYRKSAEGVECGCHYCGDVQLLQRLLFYAGVPYRPATTEERVAHYHACCLQKVESDSPFYGSFETDSAGMCRTVLAWRDALVGVGWNVKSYAGGSMKLALLRDIESEQMPKGEADYWCQLIQLAAARRILPENIQVVVTCEEREVKPHVAYILSKQQEAGVSVEYRSEKTPCADGNLGKIQRAFLEGTTDKIVLDKMDETFRYVLFANEDDALRYVATEPAGQSDVYYCSKPKRFDNMLRLLGKPTIGSSMAVGAPQVVQLFMLGNGLFEYPLNVHRIIEWLNLPISPIRGGLRRSLCNALISSGGINNEEWNEAKEDYLASEEDEKKRNKIAQELDIFLPLPQCGAVNVEGVKRFNDNLRKWAKRELAREDVHYEDIVKEQIASVESYCATLIRMLDDAPAGLDFLDLQLWCKNIAQPSIYAQYDAEVSSPTTIATMGDIHDVAEEIVWFPAEDGGTAAYPFEMLNDMEYAEAVSGGAMLYKREHHSMMNRTMMMRLLLMTKRLTIIEAERCNGTKVARHPLVLQLNERIEGGLGDIKQDGALSTEYMVADRQIINQNETPTLVQLGAEVVLKERHERHADEELQAESYSSLSSLIQHPFAYVCEKCAKLKDQEMPSAKDLEATLGNVAHLMIERVFDGRSFEEACDYYKAEYEMLFEEAVREKGLLLLLPEHAIEWRRLKHKMREALDKLAEVIERNGLTVEACEYKFKQTRWAEAGEGVTLGSRADMILRDKHDGKVIFDFKYSSGKSRKAEVAENRALQLEVYRYVTRKEFGERVPVRVAYILLPDVTILTADAFEGVEALPLKAERAQANVMAEAARSCKFRWEQLKAGKIERVEGCAIGTGEYAEQASGKGLFPLAEYDKKYSEDKYDKGYKNLK